LLLNVAFSNIIGAGLIKQGSEMTKPGRPRSEETRRAILVAAGKLLFRKGVSDFTIEQVARLSGASKVTIYKWWPSRGALALDGFFSIVSPTIDVALTGDLAADLATQAESIVALFRDTRTGPVLAGLIAEAQSDPDLAEALRTRWLDPRREAGAVVLRAAKQNGEIRADVDTTMVLDQIYGAIYIRLLLGHAPMPDGMATAMIRNLMAGIRSPSSPTRQRRVREARSTDR
jgi:AcrR family transcriptional regulator